MTRFLNWGSQVAQPVRRRHRPLPIKAFNLGTGAMLVVATLAYILQINSLSLKGYQISELEQAVAELEKQHQQLELEALSMQSLDVVRQKVANLPMVEVGQLQYLRPAPAVAIAR